MFTLTKDGNLCKDGKETKPKMTLQEFVEMFNVPKSKLEKVDGAIFYDVEDSIYDIPCEVDFSFFNDVMVDIELIISTDPFLDKCDDVSRIQDIQREECLKLIEKNIKYKEKENDGKMTVFYSAKDSEIVFLQEVMKAEVFIKVNYI